MPAKDKIQKTFFLTPAQDEYLKQRRAEIGNLSDYIRSLIAADQPGFPMDMPPAQHIIEYNQKRKKE